MKKFINYGLYISKKKNFIENNKDIEAFKEKFFKSSMIRNINFEDLKNLLIKNGIKKEDSD